MAQCFTVTCQSPPDVAYALEYTSSICNRAGYDVELELPEAYLETTDGAYFRQVPRPFSTFISDDPALSYI